ncbi:DUF6057 family protein [Paludibacter jiangxiensis]|nr:DUF6057 family protein [Paludibacter jiangxiensis]
MKSQKKKDGVKKKSLPFKNISDYTQFQLGCIALFVLLAFNLTSVQNDSVLKWIDEFSIFLPTSLFFSDCFRFAGGLLIYLGTFFTQFLYYPWLGSVAFILLLLAIQYLSIKAFRIPRHYFPLSFIPGLMLLLSVSDLGYVWMSLKSPGYFFSNALGTVSFLLLFIAYKRTLHLLLRLASLVFIVAIGYPLFGFYALFTGLIIVLYELFPFWRDKDAMRFVIVGVGLSAIVLIPQAYYYFAYSYMQQFYVYTAVLPRFFFNSAEFVLWIPFILLFLSFLLALLFLFRHSEVSPKPAKTAVVLSSIIYVCALIFTYVMSYQNENFMAEVKMAAAVDKGNWQKVTVIAGNMRGTPTRNVVLNNNLAIFKLGYNAGKGVMDINNVVPTPSVRPGMALLLMSGRSLFYNYGKINESYRWSMEGTVEFGLRVTYLKYMVKCALLNQEYALARKYNNVLSQTMFHRKWAEKYQRYIDDPRLVKEDKEMNAIRSLMQKGDSINIDFH